MKKVLIAGITAFLVLLVFILLFLFLNKKNNSSTDTTAVYIPGFTTTKTITQDGNPVTYVKNSQGTIEITEFSNSTSEELSRPFQELGYHLDSEGIYTGTLELQDVVHDMVALIPKNGKIIRVMLTYHGNENPKLEEDFRNVVRSLK